MNHVFTARTISGSGMARKQNIPTLNLSLKEIPADLTEGIYACRVSFRQIANRKSCLPDRQAQIATDFSAVMHFGPRPVHNLPPSCEVHLLDQSIADAPETVAVEIIKRIRDVRDFQSTDELKAAIQSDIAEARAILSA